MGRIFFFFLLLLAVYVGWRWWRAQRTRVGAGEQPAVRGPEPMVSCEVCRLNLPQSEALPAPGAEPRRWYCCEEHRRQALRDGQPR
jgi:hypothetical protein